MDEHNFWYWLLVGMRNIVGVLSGRMPLYTYQGLGTFVYNFLAAAATPILFYVGSLFNLCWLVVIFGIMAASEGVRALVAAYRQIVKLLPLP